MTLQELLEHAHLDALGQLDEREQAAFEAAFAVAPPAIKAQVRHEQARWAPMEHLLPQVEPSPDLRERVLDAVTAAMVSQSPAELSMRPSHRVAPAWRSASLALMTAMVMLGASFIYVYDTNRESMGIVQDGRLGEYTLKAFTGYMKDAVTSPRTERHFFEASAKDFTGSGAIWTNPGWKEARMFLDVPTNNSNECYRVVVLGPGNKVGAELDRFTSNGLLRSHEISGLVPGMTVALVASLIDKPGVADRVLMTATV